MIVYLIPDRKIYNKIADLQLSLIAYSCTTLCISEFPIVGKQN